LVQPYRWFANKRFLPARLDDSSIDPFLLSPTETDVGFWLYPLIASINESELILDFICAGNTVGKKNCLNCYCKFHADEKKLKYSKTKNNHVNKFCIT
jgi:hypothetical protein